MRPIKRVHLYQNAVEQIQNLILSRKYAPGDRMPSERTLAGQLGISRPSLREALRILNVMGLIEIKVGNGIYVKEVDFLHYIDSINASIGSRLQVETDSFLKLWQVRRILEIGMVELAIKQITDPHLTSLSQCIEEMGNNIGDQGAFISAGIRFHRLIVDAGRNEILILIWDMLANLIQNSQQKIYRIPWSPRKALSAHKKIYLALKERNLTKAKEAMKQHMMEEEKALRVAVMKKRSPDR